MIHTVLMFLAPGHGPSCHGAGGQAGGSMATRPHKLSMRAWRQVAGEILCVAGNAAGLILFLAGLGLALRLAEVLLS